MVNWIYLCVHISILTYQFWWSPSQHYCSHCSWLPQYWQCASHCRVQWLEHLFHWWWLDWGLDWQWWCSWLEPHHHTVGGATGLKGSHCPDHTAEQCRKESGEGRGDLFGRKNCIYSDTNFVHLKALPQTLATITVSFLLTCWNIFTLVFYATHALWSQTC